MNLNLNNAGGMPNQLTAVNLDGGADRAQLRVVRHEEVPQEEDEYDSEQDEEELSFHGVEHLQRPIGEQPVEMQATGIADLSAIHQ